MTGPRLASVVVGGVAESWEALGFTVEAGAVAFANGAVELDPHTTDPGTAVPALRVDGVVGLPAQVDGVPVLAGAARAGSVHPNGCTELDHVVIMTPSLERTSAALEEVLGLPLRRIRETESVRQAFHRFPDRGCIVELVESARVDRAALWGLVVIADDLDAFAAAAGADLVGAPRPAVQPGRRIATVRSAAGLACPVAVMTR